MPVEPKALRETLNKRIAAAPTLGQKINLALRDGAPPPSPIEDLVFFCAGFPPEGIPPEMRPWYDGAMSRLKQRFADLFFPALVADRSQPFMDLLEAMAKRRKELKPHRTKKLKREAGRELRIALLASSPDDRASINTVLDALARKEIPYSDESHVRRVMREIGVKLLRPGETWVWTDGRKILRKLMAQGDGKVVVTGMSRQQLSELHCLVHCFEIVPNPPDKQATKFRLSSKTS